jgi:hypothetical protein
MQLATGAMSYGNSTTTISMPPRPSSAGGQRVSHETTSAASPSARRAGEKVTNPDFAQMTPAERLAYHRQRLDRMFGG